MVVAQVPADALGAEALAGGTLRTSFGERGRLVLVDPVGRVRVLTATFDSAADPEVSYDGRRLLFAGRKAKTDPWCAWEMNVDGTGARQITCGAAGIRQPVYQPTIYTITPTGVEPWEQIAFVGVNPGERNEAGVAPNTSLWSCKADGTSLRRLTYNLSNDMDPVVLPDGRMIYAGWLRAPTSRQPDGRIGLLGVNGDGTDYQTYAGDQGLRVKQMPAPTTNGLVVFVEADRIAGDGSGRLASVSQTRPLHTYRSLSSEGDGAFRAPAALPDGRVLVSWRPGGQGVFGVYRVDAATGARERTFDQAGWHSVQAKAVVAREVPDARSSVVRDDDPDGKLYTIDVGIHDLGTKLPEATAKAMRIVEGLPATQDRPARRRILGEVPIASDGSYQVQVPANTPVQLQLLDADGLAMRTSAWLWVRNHAAQGCVGCHEDPERTPPNRLMQALAQPAPVLNSRPERRRAVTYSDVRPIVASKCLPCHGGGGQGPRLDGGAEALAPYITAGEARRSPLVWHLLGRSTVRPWDPEAGAAVPRPMPAAAVAPTAAEVKTFVEWIDLGGQP
jgi:Tol biopolymer transport system component